MKIEIEKYMTMATEDFDNFVKTLHAKQVKQLYDYLRKQLIIIPSIDMDGSVSTEHIKKKELKTIVKRNYDAMGHVPSKQESKLIRQAKQYSKQNR